MQIKQMGTHLKVSNIETSLAFYTSLGFTPVFAYGDTEFTGGFSDQVATAPEKYRGVTFGGSEGVLFEIAEGHVGIKNQDVFDVHIHTEKVSAMIKVDSLVDLFKNENVSITFPVRKYYWGTIEVALRDPDGYVLVFIAPFSDKEHSAVSKYIKIEEYKGE